MNGQIIKMDSQKAYLAWMRIAYYEGQEYSKFITDCQQNRDFFYGAQYTDDEITALEARGQFTLAVNKMRKAINGVAGLMSANQPRYQFVPVGETDHYKSTLATKLNDWVWYNSGGVHAFRKAVKSALRDNISYLHMIYSSRDRKVRWIESSFDDVIVDPKAKDPMFRDAERIYIKRFVPISVVRKYGLSEKDVVYETPSTSTSMNSDWGTTLNPNKIFSEDRQYIKLYQGYYKEYDYDENGESVVRIKRETLIGFGHAFVEDMPPHITEYPIVPLYAEDTENPYKRGETHFNKPLQRFINKAHGITILNAQLMSNPKVFVRETDIPEMDKTRFETNYARPGSVNILTGNAQEPIVIQGQPLNAAFFTLYQDAKREFEEATLPRDLLGYSDSTGQLRPDRMLDIREAVLDSYRHLSGVVEMAAVQLGILAIQFCRAYLTKDKIVRVVNADKKLEEMKVNQSTGLNIDDDRSIQMFVEQKKRAGLTDSEIQLMLTRAREDKTYLADLTYILNDVSGLDVDVFVIPGSYAPNYEMANLRLAMELHERGVVDSTAVLEHVPIENREEIIARMNAVEQQSQYIQTLEGLLDEADREAKALRKKIADIGVNQVIEEERVRQEAVFKDLRARYQVEKSKLKTQIQQIVNMTKLKAERLLLDIEHNNAARSQSNDEQGTSDDVFVRRVIDQMPS